MAEIVFVDSKVDFGCTKIHKKQNEKEQKGLP